MPLALLAQAWITAGAGSGDATTASAGAARPEVDGMVGTFVGVSSHPTIRSRTLVRMSLICMEVLLKRTLPQLQHSPEWRL
jgi:hypothetical protein